jgi:RNA polymerase sigma factor (sigma-70 family)
MSESENSVDANVEAAADATTAKIRLVEAARDGDCSAWEQLVSSHQGILCGIARGFRLCDSDVADVVQTTWVACLEHLKDLRRPELFTAWLCTMCRRESLRVARGKWRQVPESTLDAASCLAVLTDPERGPLELAVRTDDQARLREAIADLPPRQRAVLTEFLRDDGEAYAMRSRRLGMPHGSLGPTRRRAMDVLRHDSRLIAVG